VTDTVAWIEGRIWTGRRFVEAIAAEDGRIIAAGPSAEVRRALPTGAELRPLAGRLVLPGLIDAHLHFTGIARRRAGVELVGARSFAEVAERIMVWSDRHPTGGVWGGGLDDERLTERRLPTRSELDRWMPDRPMVLSRVCEHAAVLNSAGLAAVEIARGSKDPPGGTVERDPNGEPTGVLREAALAQLEGFPWPSLEDAPELGEAAFEEIARVGLSAVASLRAEPQEVAWATERLRERPGPRYFAYGRVDVPEEIPSWGWARRRDPDHLLGVKLMADGSLGARTAWLGAPYHDAPDRSGGPVFAPDRWAEAFRLADADGLRVAAHAIGDEALRTVVRAVQETRPTHRPRIEHASLVPEGLRRPLRESGVDLVVQPGFRRSDPWTGDRVGPDRSATVYPLAELLAAGIRMAGSSDGPIEPIDPFDGLRCAVATGLPGSPLTAVGALALYTTGGASVLERPELGHLEPGAAASLLVLEARELESIVAPQAPGILESWIDGVRVV
jgi:predicted amidohydrolase YtcJ